MLTGKELIASIRKHKLTIETLENRIGTSMKLVRKFREVELEDVLVIRDWVQAITDQVSVRGSASCRVA